MNNGGKTMLYLSRIQDDFSNFKNKTIIVFGASTGGKNVKRELIKHNIMIDYFVDNNKGLWGENVEGIDVLSIDKFINICKENSKVNIIIGSQYENEIANQIEELGIQNKVYYNSEFWRVVEKCDFCKKCKIDRELMTAFKVNQKNMDRAIYENQILSEFVNHIKNSDYIMNYSAVKTGNVTIISTLANYGINAINVWHTLKPYSDYARFSIKKRVKKIIIGVRDPIAQNISSLFWFGYTKDYWDIDPYVKNNNDAEYLFNKYYIDKVLKKDIHENFESIAEVCCKIVDRQNLVQEWFDEQLKKYYGIDIYQYKIDNTRKYNIVKVGDLEIFIYKLEKLNEIVQELGEFCGVPNMKISNNNLASDRINYESYLKFKKEIKLPIEYVNKCYKGKYMRFFYSEDEIKKFKEKWENNIC